MKKIALIGNMNNNFFSIARYLRDEGVDAEVIILGEEHSHFGPEKDCYDDSYKDFVLNCDWVKKGLFSENKNYQKEIRNKLKEYDFIIGCGLSAFFVHRYGLNLGIFVPYGDDLYRLPFFKQNSSKLGLLFLNLLNKFDCFYRSCTDSDIVMRFLRKLKLDKQYYLYRSYKVSYHQRLGIKNSQVLQLYTGNDMYVDVISDLGFNGALVDYPVPIVYINQYSKEALELHRMQLNFISDLIEMRKHYDVMILHHARHIWHDSLDEFSSKGNDVLFRGIAEFKKKLLGVKVGLVTLDFGPDVSFSRDLIKELNLEGDVLWLPQLARKDIMSIMSFFDFGANSFSYSWLTGGVMYEFLSMGLPLLQYRDPATPDDFPICAINENFSFSYWFERFLADKESVNSIGSEARHWYLENVVKKTINFYLDQISRFDRS